MTRSITGLTDEQEGRAQRRLYSRLEAQYRRPIAAEIARASEQMIADYEAGGSLPYLPMGHEDRLRAIYREMGLAAIRTFGARIVDQGKAHSPELQRKDLASFFEFFERLAIDWITQEAIRQRIVSVSVTTRARIISIIQQGQRDGLGVSAIAQTLRERVPFMSRQRAELIARTETHGAANYGASQTARASGLSLTKTWISAEDERTRALFRDDAYDHWSMNGQTVAQDQPFLMPTAFGEPLQIMYPGEAGHPGGATINCRCASTFKVLGGLLGD